jgi:hypothetical protein
MLLTTTKSKGTMELLVIKVSLIDCQLKLYKIIDWVSKQSLNNYGSSRDPNYPGVDTLAHSTKDVSKRWKMWVWIWENLDRKYQEKNYCFCKKKKVLHKVLWIMLTKLALADLSRDEWTWDHSKVLTVMNKPELCCTVLTWGWSEPNRIKPKGTEGEQKGTEQYETEQN